MGLFSTKTDEQKVINDLAAVTAQLQALHSVLSEKGAVIKMADEYEAVKKKLVDMRLEFDREKEKWDREKRETEHMVGLQKSRMEQEQDLAVKEATLGVREENMAAKEEMFEEKMANAVKPLEDAIDYLRTDIIKEILARMPTYQFSEHRGSTAAVQIEK